MREVVEIVRTMGPEQLLFALVFLAGYALAIGEFASARGRLIALAASVCAAAGFAALSRPWEAGIVAVGFASVGMGLFSATVWALSRWAIPAPVLVLASTPVTAEMPIDTQFGDQLPLANLARSRATSSPRSVNTAPILNSSGAE